MAYSGPEHTDAEAIVSKINEKLREFVLGTMINKRGDFENIFHELKKQFKDSRTAKTKEIIITWFTELFKAF